MNRKNEMIECRTSDKNDIDELKNLWQICFGDPKSYIDLFFENKYKEERTYVLTYNQVIAAMATAVPVTFMTGEGKEHDSVMLYAIGTRPDYRGRGYSTQLMDYVNNDFYNRGVNLSVLVPADIPLIDFYKKRGYAEAFQIREGLIHRKDMFSVFPPHLPEIVMKPTDALSYNKVRNATLAGNTCILYQDEDLLFQKKTALLSGGDVFLFSGKGVTGCGIVERISSRRIIIKELLIQEDVIAACLKKIVEIMPAEEIIVRMPPYYNGFLAGQTRVFGMAKAMDSVLPFPADGYLGIAFD